MDSSVPTMSVPPSCAPENTSEVPLAKRNDDAHVLAVDRSCKRKFLAVCIEVLTDERAALLRQFEMGVHDAVRLLDRDLPHARNADAIFIDVFRRRWCAFFGLGVGSVMLMVPADAVGIGAGIGGGVGSWA